MSDLWVFASYLAIEHLGGPAIEFVPGRPDAITGGPEHCPPEERLPVRRMRFLLCNFFVFFSGFFFKKKLDGPSHGEAVLLPLYGAFHIRY